MHAVNVSFKDLNNESLRCTPETKIILYVNYTSIKKEKENNKDLNNSFANTSVWTLWVLENNIFYILNMILIIP